MSSPGLDKLYDLLEAPMLPNRRAAMNNWARCPDHCNGPLASEAAILEFGDLVEPVHQHARPGSRQSPDFSQRGNGPLQGIWCGLPGCRFGNGGRTC